MELSRDSLTDRLPTIEQSLAVTVPGHHEAAVLVPLYLDRIDSQIIFTKRVVDLRHHGGEISFPGGRPTPHEDLLATALRESEEEIGLPPSMVEIVGALKPISTFVTGYAIYPFVGLVTDTSLLKANPSEVERVITVPFLGLSASYQRKRIIRQGMPIPTDTYQADGELVWGATARIVRQLIGVLEGSEQTQSFS